MPIILGSVGDIISISLVKDPVKSLDDIRGSSTEYQSVTCGLWSVDHALREVEVLFRSCSTSTQLVAVAQTAT